MYMIFEIEASNIPVEKGGWDISPFWEFMKEQGILTDKDWWHEYDKAYILLPDENYQDGVRARTAALKQFDQITDSYFRIEIKDVSPHSDINGTLAKLGIARDKARTLYTGGTLIIDYDPNELVINAAEAATAFELSKSTGGAEYRISRNLLDKVRSDLIHEYQVEKDAYKRFLGYKYRYTIDMSGYVDSKGDDVENIVTNIFTYQISEWLSDPHFAQQLVAEATLIESYGREYSTYDSDITKQHPLIEVATNDYYFSDKIPLVDRLIPTLYDFIEEFEYGVDFPEQDVNEKLYELAHLMLQRLSYVILKLYKNTIKFYPDTSDEKSSYLSSLKRIDYVGELLLKYADDDAECISIRDRHITDIISRINSRKKIYDDEDFSKAWAEATKHLFAYYESLVKDRKEFTLRSEFKGNA